MKLPNDYRQQAARILGVPPGNVSRRAAETVFVGNRLNRLNWTPPEIDYLVTLTGTDCVRLHGAEPKLCKMASGNGSARRLVEPRRGLPVCGAVRLAECRGELWVLLPPQQRLGRHADDFSGILDIPGR
jgi:hypothetical protein